MTVCWHSGKRDVRLQMLLDNLSSVGTEALARLGLEFKRPSDDCIQLRWSFLKSTEGEAPKRKL